MSDRIQGTVKWFNSERGYGFIARDDGEPDVFVPHDSIMMDGHRTLELGQRVTFRVEPSPRGIMAVEVEVSAE